MTKRYCKGRSVLIRNAIPSIFIFLFAFFNSGCGTREISNPNPGKEQPGIVPLPAWPFPPWAPGPSPRPQ